MAISSRVSRIWGHPMRTSDQNTGGERNTDIGLRERGC